MKAVIIGAGKVGYSIASMLSKEGQDVIVVESDQERADIVEDNLDVKVLVGNGASPSVLEQGEIANADLMVAVTESDEINMLACLFAKQAGVARTVARVRDPEYANDKKLANNPVLGIDLWINPERVTANEIANLVRIQEASGVNYYSQGKLLMLELAVNSQNLLVGKLLRELKGTQYFLIAAILRGEQIIIPDGVTRILADDHLYVMAETQNMPEVEKSLGFIRTTSKTVMILGGSRIAYYLAKYLEKDEVEVKIIEKRYERCKWLAANLDKAIVLHGDGSDIDLLQDEGISEVDVLVALTEDDKLNVLVSLLAKQLGAKKTIAQIRRSDYLPIMEKVGIDICVSPRVLTAEAILKFVRKGDLLSISLLENGGAEVYEVAVTESMRKLVNKALMDIDFPKGAIIGAIFRDGSVIIPSGSDILLAGDRITIFASASQTRKVEAIIS